MISLVVAVAQNGVMGSSHGRLGLPWHIPADLKRFKALTLGKPLIMGRTTWDLIGKALPERRCIMLSRQGRSLPGIETFSTLEAALASCKDEEETIIGGGAAVYRQALPLADWLFMTEVHLDAEGDTLFPSFSRDDWKIARRQDVAAEGALPAYSWVDYIHQPGL